MKQYEITVKRDGQTERHYNHIFAKNFADAKKEFAKLMTDGYKESSDNTIWLDDEHHEAGWYDGDYDPPELIASEKEIEKGFDYFSEDVFSYRLKKKGVNI